MLVEGRAVLQGLFVQLVGTGVGDFHRVGQDVKLAVVDGFHRWTEARQLLVADLRRVERQTLHDDGRVGGLGQALNPENHFDLDNRTLGEFLVEEPGSVGGLSPGRPLEGQIDLNPGWQALSRQAVAGLPTDIAEQNVGLKPFLKGLPLQEG